MHQAERRRKNICLECWGCFWYLFRRYRHKRHL